MLKLWQLDYSYCETVHLNYITGCDKTLSWLFYLQSKNNSAILMKWSDVELAEGKRVTAWFFIFLKLRYTSGYINKLNALYSIA